METRPASKLFSNKLTSTTNYEYNVFDLDSRMMILVISSLCRIGKLHVIPLSYSASLSSLFNTIIMPSCDRIRIPLVLLATFPSRKSTTFQLGFRIKVPYFRSPKSPRACLEMFFNNTCHYTKQAIEYANETIDFRGELYIRVVIILLL